MKASTSWATEPAPGMPATPAKPLLVTSAAADRDASWNNGKYNVWRVGVPGCSRS